MSVQSNIIIIRIILCVPIHYYSWAVFPSLAPPKPSHIRITRELIISIAYIPSTLFAAIRFIYIIIFIYIHMYLYIYMHAYILLHTFIHNMHNMYICVCTYILLHTHMLHATIYTYKYTLHKICVYV